MHQKMKILLGIFFFTNLSTCSCLKILAFLPLPMASHQIMFNSLLEELVHKGHDVTVYSNIPLKTNAPNYRHVHVSSSLETTFGKVYSYEYLKSVIDVEPFIRPSGFQRVVANLSEEVLNLSQVKALLDSSEKFDVVILETFFGQEALIGFGHRFSAPVVTLSSFGSYSLIDSMMGNPNPVSYFTSYQVPYSPDLKFSHKLKNVVITMIELYYSYFYHLPNQQAVLKRHFQKYAKSSLPQLTDLLTNVAVVLMNTQPEISYARPWVPNMISVGGLHITANRTSLPQDITKFIDSADDGFIYFSLGSTFSEDSIPEHIKESFITAFSQISQRVLWKMDIDASTLPDNVMAVKWVQQSDILAHPKCRAFITQGGIFSILEATHFAVPIIGISIMADQSWNIAKVEQAQIGIRLRFFNISDGSVTWAVNEVLHNPKYKKNIIQLSAQMRDRLLSPLNTAVYWVEYVAKHQGAPHLRCPARTMTFFQYFLVDIILCVLFVLKISNFLLKKLFNIVTLLFCKRNNANKMKKD